MTLRIFSLIGYPVAAALAANSVSLIRAVIRG
jgi:hypothetical protein